VIGVDGGGTKTACAVADETGRVLGASVGGPSNHLRLAGGVRAVLPVLHEVSREALAKAGLAGARVSVACLALAGVGLSGKCPDLLPVAAAAVCADEVLLENDAIAALVGGSASLCGVAVIAGTGSIAVGIDHKGARARSGGWGFRIGDEGSAYQIARSALTAVARARDGRGEQTGLTAKALAYYGIDSTDDLRRVLYLPGDANSSIAGFCPLVVEAAREGDSVARRILNTAGRELGLAGVAVIHSLRMEDSEFDVVPCGSVFKASDLLMEPFAAEIRMTAEKARIVPPRLPPVLGAVMLALGRLQPHGLEGRIISNLEYTWRKVGVTP
jgi:N-acetylglucosamine kinase